MGRIDSEGHFQDMTVDNLNADSSETHSLNTVHHLLSHPLRRTVIDELANGGEAVTLDDLAEEIYTRQAEVDRPPPEQRTVIAITLHHRHLPILAADGIIEYDARERLVIPTESLGQLAPFLSASAQERTQDTQVVD